MLCLASDTDPAFVERFEDNLEEMLLDHAHCEKKAASTALNFIFRYPDYIDVVDEMGPIVEEEIQHFQQVLDVMRARGWEYRRLAPSKYAGRLAKHLRPGDGLDAFVDRMLMCALIEARSCERFKLLGGALQDAELAAFYRGLFESEARHYMTYVRLAAARAGEEPVRERLAELAQAEAEICAVGETAARLHA